MFQQKCGNISSLIQIPKLAFGGTLIAAARSYWHHILYARHINPRYAPLTGHRRTKSIIYQKKPTAICDYGLDLDVRRALMKTFNLVLNSRRI